MTLLRTLATIRARHGRPGALIRVGTSGGRLLYLEAAMDPVSVVTALERLDVVALRNALDRWLAETAETRPRPVPVPAAPPAPGGGEWSHTPCVCSDYADQHEAGGTCRVLGCPCLVYRPVSLLATVQSCMVAQPRQPADQQVSP